MKTTKKILDNKKVLLLEDDEVDQMLLKLMVEGEGAKIQIENNPESIVNLLLEDRFDLILMDARFGNSNSLNLVRKLRTNMSFKIPIIGMTSVNYAGRGMQSGMDAIIRRPIEKSKFNAALNEALNKP